ncbi:MAG: AI-2E family transporter [Chloroflexota bacterium]|nr:AI-2E family transporter [Chloroflexota bacterium]
MSSSDQTNTSHSAIVPTSTWLRRLIITLTILSWIALALVLFWLVGRVAQALLLLAVGALLAYVLYPFVHFLQRVMPSFLAVIIVYLLVLIALGILFYFVAIAVIGQLISLIQYVQSLINSGPNQNSQVQPILDALQQAGISQAQLRSVGQQLLGQLQGVVTNVFLVVSSMFAILLNTFLAAMLSIYFLFAGPKITHWLRQKTPLRQREQINFLIDTMQRIVGGYVRGTLTLGIVFSILTGIGVALIGVPYPFLLAVFSFVLEFVPFLGVYITGAAIVLLALTKGWVTGLLALGLFVILQNLENNVLSPRIVGGAVGINPIINVFAVIAGANLFGLPGAFFAAPAAGFIQALIQAIWSWWKKGHPDQFPDEQKDAESLSKGQKQEAPIPDSL